MTRTIGWLTFVSTQLLLAALGLVLWGHITGEDVELGAFTTSIKTAAISWATFFIVSGYFITSAITFHRKSLSTKTIISIVTLLFIFQYWGFVWVMGGIIPSVSIFGFFLGIMIVPAASLVASRVMKTEIFG